MPPNPRPGPQLTNVSPASPLKNRQLIHDELQCQSPAVMTSLLLASLDKNKDDNDTAALGTKELCNQPNVYDDYHIVAATTDGDEEMVVAAGLTSVGERAGRGPRSTRRICGTERRACGAGLCAGWEGGGGRPWVGLEEVARKRYRHRLSFGGQWLWYLALVFRKVN